MVAQVPVGEPARDKHEHPYCIENGLGIGVAEA
jgi:hypothetical protein